MIRYYIYIYIYNCNWVDTRWQWNNTHLHTNNTQNTENGTYITIKKLTNLGRLWVRIPPGAWMSVCCECCVLSGRRLCDGLITRPEEFYRLWRVVCVISKNLVNEVIARVGLQRHIKKNSNPSISIENIDFNSHFSLFV
jgi:hypothetical protein